MGKGRSHARILTSIWDDDDWRSLSFGAQWLYELILSQNRLSYSGVLPWTPARWAKLARGVTPKAVRAYAVELVVSRFLVIDEDTEEVWVRTFVKHDGILKSPNIKVAMWRDFRTILSEPIRKGFLEELPKGEQKPLPEPPDEPKPKPPEEPRTEPVEPGSRVHGAQPLSPIPHPSPSPPSKSSSQQPGVVGANEDDDEDRIQAATTIVAERRFAKTDAAAIGKPRGWKRSVASNLRTERASDLQRWAQEGWTAERMADELEPPEQHPAYHRPFGSDQPVWTEDTNGRAIRVEAT